MRGFPRKAAGKALGWEQKHHSHLEEFRVVLGRILRNKICTIDSVANENLSWTLWA